jgi:GDPmannose 4,6-dehydratase
MGLIIKNMKIIITGINGQDGSLMADYLLKNTDARIFGVVRQTSKPNYENIEHLLNESRFEVIHGDVADPHSMSGIIRNVRPDYFINFAALSFVGSSWDTPTEVFSINTNGVMNQLEAIRQFSPHTRYYQAGSSEEFADAIYTPQDEKHPLGPKSPYAASKAAARYLVKVYRETYGLYAVDGILFNHEGVRRGDKFITRKITKGVAQIRKAIDVYINGRMNGARLDIVQNVVPVLVGNIEVKRDWSDAEDFVDGVWRMLNQELYNEKLAKKLQEHWSPHWERAQEIKFLSKEIKDYVLASGENHSVREFIESAFDAADIIIKDANLERLPPCRNNTNKFGQQVIYTLQNNQPVVMVDSQFYRPNDVNFLLGDSSLARKELGWCPKTGFKELVSKMLKRDLSH